MEAMSDTRRRSLERRWRESGAGSDHARFLVERLRAGEVEPEQVLLAAHLGDPGAREALGLGADAATSGQRAWTTALGAWKGHVPARAALAAARLVLPVFDRGLNPDPRPRRALRAGEACVVCPCEPHGRRAAAAAEQADALASGDAGTAVWAAVQATCAVGDEVLPLLEAAVMSATRVAGVVAVRGAVRDALVPWTLGYEDPLARRLGGVV